MTAADKIRKLGFKRWYERALIEGHAYLVTAFFGMILAVASIELIGQHLGGMHTARALGGGILGTAIALYGIRRYLHMLGTAEAMSDHATCRQCNTYAAFNILASGSDSELLDSETAEPNDPDSVWLKVKCRKCGNEWTL